MLLSLVFIKPAWENILSEATEVACIHSKSLAIFAKEEKFDSCFFHQNISLSP